MQQEAQQSRYLLEGSASVLALRESPLVYSVLLFFGDYIVL